MEEEEGKEDDEERERERERGKAIRSFFFKCPTFLLVFRTIICYVPIHISLYNLFRCNTQFGRHFENFFFGR